MAKIMALALAVPYLALCQHWKASQGLRPFVKLRAGQAQPEQLNGLWDSIVGMAEVMASHPGVLDAALGANVQPVLQPRRWQHARRLFPRESLID